MLFDMKAGMITWSLIGNEPKASTVNLISYRIRCSCYKCTMVPFADATSISFIFAFDMCFSLHIRLVLSFLTVLVAVLQDRNFFTK